MKPMRTGGGTAGILIGALCLATPTIMQERNVPKNSTVIHASLAAYPSATISLKDPRTEMLFYVESNGRRLVAFDKDGAVVWSVDVLDEVEITPALGEPVIRHLQVEGEVLWITCGKSDTAKAHMKTGKIEYVGRD